MSFEVQAKLGMQKQFAPPKATDTQDLVGRLADMCLSWHLRSAAGKSVAREHYRSTAPDCHATLPQSPPVDIDPEPLLPGWVVITATFKLETPWYSKDDRPMHVLDNPVRKDRVFGVPFMSASSWKGLLRWAAMMTTGLIGPEPIKNADSRGNAEAVVKHLFGNDNAEESEEFTQGALVCSPTWFGKVGFEVINPHSREMRAGRQPIIYEVVPPETDGSLRYLYAPTPGSADANALHPLLRATRRLLEDYGFSAKRTAGWGLARVTTWQARAHGDRCVDGFDNIKAALPDLVGGSVTEVE